MTRRVRAADGDQAAHLRNAPGSPRSRTARGVDGAAGVRHEIVVAGNGAPPERRVLAAAGTGGGSRADALLLPGAPPAAVRLLPVPAGVVVEAAASGVRVGGHAVAPGARRLLRPGERAEIQGASIALEPRAQEDGTRVAAAALLRDAAAGADALSGPRLVVLTGPEAGRRLGLAGEQTVGRGRAATLRLADPQISRAHARVRAGPEGVSVEDLRSKNGTRVNGVPLERRRSPLRPGDELALGTTILVLEDAAPAGAPPARRTPTDRPRRRHRTHAAAAVLLALSAAALALAGS